MHNFSMPPTLTCNAAFLVKIWRWQTQQISVEPTGLLLHLGFFQIPIHIPIPRVHTLTKAWQISPWLCKASRLCQGSTIQTTCLSPGTKVAVAFYSLINNSFWNSVHWSFFMHFSIYVSHLVMSNSSQPHGLQPTRLLCPWNSPGKNTGVDSHSLLQGMFPTQQLNPGLLHCRQILYHLSHQRNMWFLFCPRFSCYYGSKCFLSPSKPN